MRFAGTIGVSEKSYVDNYRTPHTNQIHEVKGFKLIEDRRKLQALLTVIDPTRLQHALVGRSALASAEGSSDVKNLCAENNADFFNYDEYPIPQATKSDFGSIKRLDIFWPSCTYERRRAGASCAAHRRQTVPSPRKI